MSAAGWAAKQSLVAQVADKTAEKAPATSNDAMLAIAALGVVGATAAAAGIAVDKRREE